MRRLHPELGKSLCSEAPAQLEVKRGFPMAQMVKSLPAMQKTWV